MEINPILVAKSDKSNYLLPKMANRHGLIAGATGTGKTVSLQVLAEGFSRIGVPVFLADVKGDLAGISQPGGSNSKVSERIESLQLSNFEYEGSPVVFWDIYGKKGHPVRTTISEMGPFLLSRLLNLNDTQSATLTLIFRAADDARMLLLDMKDIRSMVQYVGENADKFNNQYGRVSTASIGAIQRALLNLEEAGGDVLFGEPALNIDDLMQTDANGKGIINILASDKLILSPAVYSTFLLWLMSEMFEELPEVGDMDKPKIVFFFDEAHLLFDEAPKALQDKIEQVVRLIRSKGVGVYFVTQNPTDIPDDVLGQLGNRVQHALRAFTPRDQKAIKVAAETFRINPNLDVEKAISEVEVGEALVSFLNEDGAPSIVERAYVLPPHSKIGPITDEQRKIIIESSAVFGTYEEEIDRESAYEMLNVKAQIEAKANQVQTPVQQPNVMNTNPQNTAAPRGGRAKSLLNNVVRNLTGGGGAGGIGRAITGGSGGGIAKKIMRGILGTFLR